MHIVMDDAGDITAEDLANYPNLTIIPVNIMFGTTEFTSDKMSHAEFYEKTKTVTNDNFPKTSQPSPYQFEEVYKALIAQGKTEILTITVSDRLSGTYASAVTASKALADQATFHLFDSKTGSGAQGYIALEAAKMAQDGADYATIKARLETMRNEGTIYFLIDSLEYAVKGGRVSTLRSAMASLLNIKPIMTVDDGLIVEAVKVRTYKKALREIVALVKKDMGTRPVRLSVLHAGTPVNAQVLLTQAKPQFNAVETRIVDMAVAVAINLGPGALGLVAVPA